jgi:hypothetical protein
MSQNYSKTQLQYCDKSITDKYRNQLSDYNLTKDEEDLLLNSLYCMTENIVYTHIKNQTSLTNNNEKGDNHK